MYEIYSSKEMKEEREEGKRKKKYKKWREDNKKRESMTQKKREKYSELEIWHWAFIASIYGLDFLGHLVETKM